MGTSWYVVKSIGWIIGQFLMLLAMLVLLNSILQMQLFQINQSEDSSKKITIKSDTTCVQLHQRPITTALLYHIWYWDWESEWQWTFEYLDIDKQSWLYNNNNTVLWEWSHWRHLCMLFYIIYKQVVFKMHFKQFYY